MSLALQDKFHSQSDSKLPPGTFIEADGNAEYSQFESPELEKQIVTSVASTTKVVRDGADKDDLREAFARLAKLKARRHPIDIYRIECRMNLGDFR